MCSKTLESDANLIKPQTPSPNRQLAAIMFTGIKGYNSLLQERESMALQIIERKKAKLEKEVALHHGRILEFRSDGALCSFNSTLECVRAAISLQHEMMTAPSIPVGIGIHTGDVVISGDLIYGEGVNIAARMESVAVAGSILISERVYEDIKNHVDINVTALGKYSLKNVKEEIALYAISNRGIVVPDIDDPDAQGNRIEQRCILVLPFVNMSNDPSQEYFSDGLTEELISNLSRLKDARVISRTTSMKYKNTTRSMPDIGQEAGANYIMEGSVRTAGNMIRITVQLVDAMRDVHLWTENYSGTLDDIFDIQEKVATNIVEALRIHLTEDEMDSLQKRYTGNTEAYQLYLQGRFFWNKRNENSLKTAVRYFENAIQKDPEYALAWAGLADTYNLLSEFANLSRKELHPMAKEAVHKALAIDHTLAEAHISLACLVMLNEWDWEHALKEFRIGLELNPNYATGHHWMSEWYLFMGNVDEALREIAIAVDLDPVSQAIIRDEGLTLYYAGQYDRAMEKALIALDIDPDFIAVHRLLSLCYLAKGMYDAAIIENKKWGALTMNEVKTKIALAHIYATAGRRNEAEALLDDIHKNYIPGENDYRSIALIYASLGDHDAAFAWLEESYDRREAALSSLKIDPKLDVLRGDPRFDALVSKMRLVL